MKLIIKSKVQTLQQKAALYYNTLKYLKSCQIFFRIWYKVKIKRVKTSPSPKIRKSHGFMVACIEKKQSLISYRTFHFLNKTYRLLEIGWDGDKCSKLWRYNQHYFDDLNARGSPGRKKMHQDLITDWIKTNKPGLGTGWEQYPTSLRVVNWIKWGIRGNSLTDETLQSLATQIRWLNNNLEWHILGNHLFSNAKALIFAGFFFEGKEADKWRNKGWKILINQLSEQVLADGGHFELSPMYHSIFLEDILDIINLKNVFPNIFDHEHYVKCVTIATKMLYWFEVMSHQDGEIAFFNDAAIGISANIKEIKLYINRLGFLTNYKDSIVKNISYDHLRESGYISVKSKDMCLIIDVASIGPDYLPGHGHADVLSFELSLFGMRTFVNSGTSEYKPGIVRHEERSTQSHNTVVINNKNSSEIWSSFRVANRARPYGLKIKKNNNIITISCAHDGYNNLPGKPIHRRFWEIKRNSIIITDKIDGKFDSAFAYYHLHPNVILNSINKTKWVINYPNSKKKMFMTILSGISTVQTSHYAAEFGKRLPNKSLSLAFQDTSVIVELSWIDL